MLELALGALLFAGLASRPAAIATIFFLLFTTAAVILLALKRPGLACGCGMRWLTLGHDVGPWGVVIRNTCLLGVALALRVFNPRSTGGFSA